jgi:diacylglycerol O-acyltransferase / wax synthase
MDNVLDLVDDTFFRVERAADVTNVIQCIWVYDRAPDIDGLRRFHRHLQRGRLSRRIERSPLPFGRNRWVSPDAQPQLEITETPRPRAEFDAWLDEQSNIRLDAERGPGWHLAVLPFTDGGAGVSLIASHCLTDAVGLCQALADAAGGNDNAIDWPALGSRGRWQALREDARQTVRDIPAIGRAVVDAARFLRGNSGAAEPVSAPTLAVDEEITFPTATFFVDAGEWDDRARALGGTGNGLFVALAARLAQRVDRVAADGSVAVTMAINERTDDDTRANAIKNVDFAVDPAPATADLSGIRAATKQALVRSQHEPDARWTLLPLVPLVPERLGKRWVGAATNSAATVGSSNVGAVDPATNRPDGTEANHFAIRSLSARMTTGMLHQLGGLLSLLSGRMNGRVFVSVVAYEPGGSNSETALRQHISDVLDEFALASTMGWPCAEPAVGR